MTTTDNERYIRLMLMTFEGGTWICKKILYREVDRLPGCRTLAAYIRTKESIMKHKQIHGHINTKQYKLLFPRSGADTCVDDWDLSLIIKVILTFFRNLLTRQESAGLEYILQLRNVVLCHANQMAIREHEFNSYWNRLTEIIQRLAFSFDEETKQIYLDMTSKFLSGPLDLQSSVVKLTALCRNDELMNNVLTALARLERGQKQIASGVATVIDKLEDTNTKIDGANTKLDATNTKIDDANTKINGTNTKLDATNTKLDDANTQLDATNTKLDDAKSKLDDANTQLDATNTKLDDAKSKLDDANTQLDATNTKLNDAISKLDDANTKLDATNTKLDDAKSKLDDANTKLDATNTKLDDAKSKLDATNTKLDDAKSKLDDANTKLDDTHAKLDDANSKQDDTNRKLDVLQEDMKKLLAVHSYGKCRDIPILKGKVSIRGTDEAVAQAEEILLKVSKADDPNDKGNVANAYKQFNKDLEKKDAVLDSTDTGSIILNIKCLTVHALDNMLSVFRTNDNRWRLHGLEKALSDMLHEHLEVELVLPDETIEIISKWIDGCLNEMSSLPREDTPYTRTISMGIQCRSAEAVTKIVNYFHSEESVNRLNQLSEALSKAVKDKVTVEVQLDTEGFLEVLKSLYEMEKFRQEELRHDAEYEDNKVEMKEEVASSDLCSNEEDNLEESNSACVQLGEAKRDETVTDEIKARQEESFKLQESVDDLRTESEERRGRMRVPESDIHDEKQDAKVLKQELEQEGYIYHYMEDKLPKGERSKEIEDKLQSKHEELKDESQFSIYCNIHHQLLAAEGSTSLPEDVDTGSERDFPCCCSSEQYPCKYFSKLMWKVARLAFYTLFSKQREVTLVFDYEEARVNGLSTEEVDLCLKIGIITEVTSPTQERKYVSFPQKTNQDYFVSIFLSFEGKKSDFDRIRSVTRDLDSALELDKVIVFCSEINPNVVEDLSLLIAEKADKDSRVQEYRKSYDRVYVPHVDLIEKIQKTIIPATQPNAKVFLSDIFFYNPPWLKSCGNWVRNINITVVKSIHVDNPVEEEVLTALKQARRLQKLVLYNSGVQVESIHTMILKNRASLLTLGLAGGQYRGYLDLSQLEDKFPDSLTAKLSSLSLRYVTLSHKQCLVFSKILISSRNLVHVTLSYVSYKEPGDGDKLIELDFTGHRNLQTIKLWKLPFGDISLSPQALQNFRINLPDNQSAQMSLIQCLKSTRNLRKLTCWSIIDSQELVKMLPLLLSLQKVVLAHIDFGDLKQVRMSAKMVKLESVELFECTISDGGLKSLIKSLPSHRITVQLVVTVKGGDNFFNEMRKSYNANVKRDDVKKKENMLEAIFTFEHIARQ